MQGRARSPWERSTLRQLEVLVEAVSAHHAGERALTGAARALDADVGTVLTTLNRLASEKAWSVALLQKTGPDRYGPTPDAIALADMARPVIEAFRRFSEDAERLTSGEPTVRFSAYPAAYPNFAAEVISDRDDCVVEVVAAVDERRRDEGNAMFADLRSGRVDVAVGPLHAGNDGDEALDRRYLYSNSLVALDFSERLPRSAKRIVGVAELAPFKLLTSPEGHSSRRILEEQAAISRVHLDVAAVSPNVPTLVSLGSAGMGIPVMPSDSLAHELSSARGQQAVRPRVISVVGHDGAALGSNYYVWWRTTLPERLQAPVQGLVDALELAASKWDRAHQRLLRGVSSRPRRRPAG